MYRLYQSATFCVSIVGLVLGHKNTVFKLNRHKSLAME